MLNLKKIFKVGKICLYLACVLMVSFFSCQCLAMRRGEEENFRRNIDALFREELSIRLNRIDNSKFELKITKMGLYEQKNRKKFIGEVKTNGDSEFVQFTLVESMSPIIFVLKDGMCELSYLDERVSVFKSNIPIIISQLYIPGPLRIKAPKLTVLGSLKSDTQLCLRGNDIVNNGSIFAPEVNMYADNSVTNSGAIAGDNVSLKGDYVRLLGGNIDGQECIVTALKCITEQKYIEGLFSPQECFPVTKAKVAKFKNLSAEEVFRFKGSSEFAVFAEGKIKTKGLSEN